MEVNFLVMSITTRDVTAVLCPSHPGVVCDMVREKVESRSKSGAAEEERCVPGGGRAEGRRRRRTDHDEIQSGVTTRAPTSDTSAEQTTADHVLNWRERHPLPRFL